MSFGLQTLETTALWVWICWPAGELVSTCRGLLSVSVQRPHPSGQAGVLLENPRDVVGAAQPGPAHPSRLIETIAFQPKPGRRGNGDAVGAAQPGPAHPSSLIETIALQPRPGKIGNGDAAGAAPPGPAHPSNLIETIALQPRPGKRGNGDAAGATSPGPAHPSRLIETIALQPRPGRRGNGDAVGAAQPGPAHPSSLIETIALQPRPGKIGNGDAAGAAPPGPAHPSNLIETIALQPRPGKRGNGALASPPPTVSSHKPWVATLVSASGIYRLVDAIMERSIGELECAVLESSVLLEHLKLGARRKASESRRPDGTSVGGLHTATLTTGDADQDRRELQAITAALQWRFGQRTSVEQSREQLASRYRHDGESLGAFVADVQLFTQRGYPTFPVAAREELSLHSFLRGLAPERLRQHVRLSTPRSLEEALREAECAEEVLGAGSAPGRSPAWHKPVRAASREAAGEALVDTGSTICLLRQGVLPGTAGPLPADWTPTTTELLTVTGEKTVMPGKKLFLVVVGAQQISHEFWLADIRDDCIVGLDLLARWGACVDVPGSAICLGAETTPLRSGRSAAGESQRRRGSCTARASAPQPPHRDYRFPAQAGQERQRRRRGSRTARASTPQQPHRDHRSPAQAGQDRQRRRRGSCTTRASAPQQPHRDHRSPAQAGQERQRRRRGSHITRASAPQPPHRDHRSPAQAGQERQRRRRGSRTARASAPQQPHRDHCSPAQAGKDRQWRRRGSCTTRASAPQQPHRDHRSPAQAGQERQRRRRGSHITRASVPQQPPPRAYDPPSDETALVDTLTQRSGSS
ncbi:hypothetical protein Q8A73_002757 [Channa argus]|nr:hypothetical protein Q8A73_002757 [Channa argus]